MSGYELIYMDPSWGEYTNCGTAKIEYTKMTTEELFELPLDMLMAQRCVLFCWVTCPMLYRQNGTVLKHWEQKFDLTFQGVPYVWIKTRKDGTPFEATGPRPRLTKPLTEFCVAYSNVKRGRPFPLLTEKQVQTVFAPRPGGHSSKPPIFRERIVELLGDRPRVELFARERVAGWDGWGDQYPLETAANS